MADNENAREMAPTQMPVELHKWLKLEAVQRDSTITAQLTEAVLLLRRTREGATVKVRRAQPQTAAQP